MANQLFQYAAARALVYHHPETQIYVEEEKDNPHNVKRYDYAKIFMKHAIVVKEMSCPFEFHQDSSFVPWYPETLHPSLKLCGYFQYLPAIVPILPDLVREFQQALYPFLPCSIDPFSSMFIHIRRGDYLQLPHYHFIQTPMYYEKAFQEWRKRYVGNDFTVFMMSDDPDWCREQPWSFPYKLYENDDEIKTLALMSQCQAGAIIANSSFSYWGAMLSQSPHVFYPRDWIAETVHDLFPSHWSCVNG